MKIKTILLSSLAKVFPDECPDASEYIKMSMLKNEKSSFQLAFCAEKDACVKLDIISEIKPFIKVYNVCLIPAKLAIDKGADDFVLREGKPGLYPDLLKPVEGEITAQSGKWQSIWFEIELDGSQKAGKYKIELDLSGEKNVFELEIINASLPEQDLICTHWFHTDCLMSWYKVEAFSEEYWRITENFARAALRHGTNCLLTPLFTPALDTDVGEERPTVQLVDIKKVGYKYSFSFEKLERWIEMCNRVGIKYFEMCHLFTQWGAEHAPKIMAEEKGEIRRIFGWETDANSRAYKSFLTAFAAALTAFIDEKGIRDRCIFHTSDEPSRVHYYQYRRCARLIDKLFPGFKTVDALSDFMFYEKGLVKTPIPADDHIEPFLGKVPELWTYYCCSQRSKYASNRFFAMPSLRNRILGWQMYKYDIKGFLQWGFNFWYARLSKYEINPFEVADAGEAYSAGDPFVTYPAPDGTAYISLRLKVFYDAFQDNMAMKLLESKIGKDKVVAIIEEGLNDKISFSVYPHEDEWMLSARERINAEIKKIFN